MKTKLRVTQLSEQLKKGTLFVGLGGLFVIVVQLMDLEDVYKRQSRQSSKAFFCFH